jgi:predicted acyl esterase
MRVRTRVAPALTAVCLLAGLTLTTASVAAADPVGPIFVDGQAQIVPEFQSSAGWIRERLWVETEFDTDGDGVLDRMHTDVTRPGQTASEGLKVPVIYESSPYYAGTASTSSQYFWNVHHELGAPPPPRTSPPDINYQSGRTSVSNSEVNTWVPRGFAVVHSDSVGTGLSDGCPTVGGINESLAPKAVIDWLNGRAKGYTTRTGSEEVAADWTTGKVGMTGTSYNGTLPLAAATTGVEGLEAIIPIAPNTSYYHYYRSNGLVRNPGGWLGEDTDYLFDYISSGDPAKRAYCRATIREDLMKAQHDRVTGDYNAFWLERDYLPQLDAVTAATLMAHAFNDWNVVPEHSVRIYEDLKDNGIPLMAYYHQGGHGGAPPLVLRNLWFSRYLYDVPNGIENAENKAWIVREAATCPPRTATVVGDQSNTATLSVDDTSQLGLGFSLTVPQTNSSGTITNTTRTINRILDGQTLELSSAVATATGQRVADGTVVFHTCSTASPSPYADYPNPAGFDVPFFLQAGGATAGGFTPLALGDDATETIVDDWACGTGFLATNATAQRLLYTTPVLDAPLHISGTARVTVRMAASAAAANLSVALVRLPWSGGSGCTSGTQGSTTSVITRAWADPKNHADTFGPETPLTPGEFVDVAFDLQPDDQIIPAGMQVGLMIFSSDREFTLRPTPGTELSVALGGTSLELPVVGGRPALGICASADPSTTVVIGGVDSKVPNRLLTGSCTIANFILDEAAWASHGDFVDHLAAFADELLAAGVISGRERGAIVSAGARSGVGA